MMRRTISLCCLLFGLAFLGQAQNKNPQRFNVEEFRAKQKDYLREKAGLTHEETKAFFPVYFELQDKKAKIHEETWRKSDECERKEMTDHEYEEILKELANSRIACDKLDLEYIEQFKKIIPPKKIYLIQRAEIQFHRHMLKIMHRPQGRHPDKERVRRHR
ncbi:hypothetical protein [Phocaeicola abscessus]|uniref:hypothetical protein n=1 Tax=Phocaeicola abscessus TaxID=555313 RepID=UPI0004002465|nr:hypothetical protein [Phocaeicola abscessus]